MILFKKADALRNYLEQQVKNGKKTGFVPTMGALHAGHISLAETCKKQNDLTIASIFVNPTQFNDPADFSKYPVTLEKDLVALEQAGCDVLFLPSVPEMYPSGQQSTTHYPLGFLEETLEGAHRPGHFQGVCQVVHRLLDIVNPHQMYLGQKDYQQCMVIRKLIELLGKSGSTRLMICPTIREKDGLAMSSRNLRLNEEERKLAPSIFEGLRYIQSHIHQKSSDVLKDEVLEMLTTRGFRVDYVEVADATTLLAVKNWNGKEPIVSLIAAFINDVRLIDNMVIT
jgi:pantoate--beta-alanine ligase